MTTVVGFDPGLAVSGYGVLELSDSGIVLLAGDTIVTNGDEPLAQRLLTIYRATARVLAEFAPQALALEDLYSHYRHPATVILMGHARGVVCLAAAQAGVAVYNYPPAAIKSAVAGNGQASKEQVQRMVQVALGLPQPPHPDHVADALAAALCHAFRFRPSSADGKAGAV